MGHIVGYDAGTSEQWVGWTAGNSEEAEEFVRGLGLAPGLETGYLGAVGDLEQILVDGRSLAGGLWYPDPTDLPWGQFTLTYLYPDAGTPLDPDALLKRVRKPEKIRGTRLLDHSAALGDVDAGQALIEVEVRGFKDTGVVLSRIAASVFPTGADEVMRFEFQTNVPTAFEALSQEALTIVQSLTVEVG
ncbi:hypothetical protein [Luteimicrobium sp. DT211]|uniref:hypothetical protein n=1 Tax=Luteimicrobium sp. DT211 TaxID=3393412 RepID=UPI003CF0F78D